MSKVNSNLFREDPAAYYTELGVEAERERILRAFYKQRRELEEIVIGSESFGATDAKWFYQDRIKELDRYITLIKGEQK